jgi:hypothetical protein
MGSAINTSDPLPLIHSPTCSLFPLLYCFFGLPLWIVLAALANYYAILDTGDCTGTAQAVVRQCQPHQSLTKDCDGMTVYQSLILNSGSISPLNRHKCIKLAASRLDGF